MQEQEELLAKSRDFMKKDIENEKNDELRPEYDLNRLQGGVRGKYAERYRQGTNLVKLEPDIAKAFPNDKSVNDALRLLIELAESQINK